MHRLHSSSLLRLFREYSGLQLRRLLYVGALVGLTSALLIALVNYAARMIAEDDLPASIFFIFVPLLVCYLVLIRLNNKENISNTELLIYRFRMRVMSLILKTDVSTLDTIGRAQILTALSRDAQTICSGVTMLVPIAQSVSMLIFAVAYLFIISIPAALITLIFALVVSTIATRAMKTKHAILMRAWTEEGLVTVHLAEMLSGFKEIKLNSSRATEISADLIALSRKVTHLKTQSTIGLSNIYSAVQILIYVLIGVIIFVVPVISQNFSSQVVSVSTTVLFIAGSLTGMIQTLPYLSQADTAADEIIQFMDKLEIINNQDFKNHEYPIEHLHSIRLENITLHYPAIAPASSFVIGPISYEFKAGEVYFIRGGNGSGKTSLIKMLSGLSPSDGGRIYVNDQEVVASDSQSYRDLFSAIFGDFHLFQKLYGIENQDETEINYWLEKLEILDKVQYTDGRFTTLNLSTGQKKRIALLVSILEKRPVIILDEWASDQDPEFRRFFYEIIIPELRAMKKMVIAITHDDNYFDSADHLLLVDQGRLYEHV